MKKKWGILMGEEQGVSYLLEQMTISNKQIFGNRVFYEGELENQSIVVAFSKWGKVASALTTTTMILKYSVDSILFVGTAGGLSPSLEQSDIVIGQSCFQHDMDARPIFPRYEVPLTGRKSFDSDPQLIQLISSRLGDFFNQEDVFSHLPPQITSIPQYKVGNIATGDQFIRTEEMRNEIQNNLPDILCVEMEGAAVGQVCYSYQCPFIIVRSISDSANEQADIDFQTYVTEVIPYYSYLIVRIALS